MAERELYNRIMLSASKIGARLFRNNTGQGWVGKVKGDHQLEKCRVIELINARPLHSGLCKGSSDLIGWTPLIITPAMVGQKIAVFTAIECKGGAKTKTTKEQTAFIKAVNEAGGIGLFAREEGEALNYLSKSIKR